MQSSLDDLLNEIDSALTTAPVPTSTTAPEPAKSEIDDLLQELDDLGGKPQPATLVVPTRIPKSKGEEKCYALCIGGPRIPTGVSYSTVDPKVCSSLRCTGCDHSVISFPDKVWAQDCEYYFFRNNYQRPALLQEVIFYAETDT